MILTTHALKVELAPLQNPVSDLINHIMTVKQQDAYKRKGYFVRYIGSDESKDKKRKALEEWAKELATSSPFLYLTKLDGRLSYEESQIYSKVYEEWEKARERGMAALASLSFPVPLKSDMLVLTQKSAFTEVMAFYEKSMPQSNETIKRNFGVKLLHWIATYLPCLYGKNENSIPKILYGGSIKMQEFLFLYWLYLMGCDVVYCYTQEDLAVSFPECQYISSLYKGKYQFEMEWPEILGQVNEMEHKTPEASSGMTSGIGLGALGKGEAKESISSSSRGSINLAGRPRKKQQDQSTQNHIGTSSSAGGTSRSRINLSREASHSGINLVRGTSVINEPNSIIRHENDSKAIRRELSYEALAKLSTSIVMIEVKNQLGESYASGSGVVIHEAGFILTNFHVVRGGALFGVKFENDDQIYVTNRVIKYHADYDLAIIKVERSCKPLPLFKGAQVVRGQKVVAIGSPLGLFNSISDGIISGFREFEFMRMIQFTAPTSHGSSGGALLNLYGELIGICTAGYDEGQNLNLAVDYETIQRFAGNYL